MSKIIYALFIFFFFSSKNYILSTKAIVFPLRYSFPNEPTVFEPNNIISYYSKNDIYTSLKMGKNKQDLTIVFDDNDSSFIIKEGYCPSESDYSLSGSSTAKYDDGILYQYANDALIAILNNTRDKAYLNQADKEYFYLSLKDRRFGKNLNQLEVNDFSFLYAPNQEELSQIHKKEKKKKDGDDINGDGYNDDVYKDSDEDDNPYSPYYPGNEGNDNDDNPFTPYYPDNDNGPDFSPKCGYMGLLPQGIRTGLNDAKINFIQQLKNKRIIDNYNWYIRYNKDKTGELVIGAAPHEVRPENYLEEDLYTTHARLINDLFYWEIDFSSIELFDERLNKGYPLEKKSGVIFINTSFIHSPKSFYDQITSIFFRPYFDTNKCKLEKINKYESMYQVIYCHQSNFTENDLKKFPVLLFESNELNFIFNFDYNDLFLKTRNVYIFKIIYSAESSGYWKLGKTFLEKYQFVFNYDSKTLGFYQKFIPENLDGDQVIDPDSNPNKENKGNDKLPPSNRKEMRDKEKSTNAKKNNALKIVLIIGLVILVVLIGFYIVRKFLSSKQVNSKIIEGHKKSGNKRKRNKDNAILEDAEEIN